MVACAWTRVVPTPSSSSASCDQERVVGVRLVDDPLDVGQGEGTRVLAVACLARTPVAAERLLIEELLTVDSSKLILAKPVEGYVVATVIAIAIVTPTLQPDKLFEP